MLSRKIVGADESCTPMRALTIHILLTFCKSSWTFVPSGLLLKAVRRVTGSAARMRFKLDH